MVKSCVDNTCTIPAAMTFPSAIRCPHTVLAAVAVTILAALPSREQDGLRIERSTIVEGDAQWDWTQARTACVPGQSPLWLTTMSRTAKVGSHGYHDVYLVISHDHGKSWSAPEVIPSLRRTKQNDGYEVAAGCTNHRWHNAAAATS